jgi:hypothetical protein
MGKKGWDSLKWSSSIKKKFNKKNLLGRPKRMWLKLIEIWSPIYSRWPCRNPPTGKTLLETRLIQTNGLCLRLSTVKI